MLVQCTQCSKTLKVPDTAAGKRIRCPACSAIVDVPQSASKPPAASASEAVAQNPAAVSPPVRRCGPSVRSRAVQQMRAPLFLAAQKRRLHRQRRGKHLPVGLRHRVVKAVTRFESGRGTPARSTSSQRPRKQSRPVEQEDDDFGYGSYEDDGATILSRIHLHRRSQLQGHRLRVPEGKTRFRHDDWLVLGS